MLIPTKFGDIDSDGLVLTTGLVDDTARFGRFWEFRRPGEADLAARYEQNFIDKTRSSFPHLPPTETVMTDQGGVFVPVPVAELERTDVLVDDANEFTQAVEYRRPGAREYLHRSVHVQLKRLPTDNPALQGFVG